MKVNIRETDRIVIFDLRGKISGNDDVELKKLVNNQIAAVSGKPKFLFNFADVTGMDTNGFEAIVGARLAVERKGGRVGAINVGANIHNLLVVSRLTTTFEHFDTEAQAIESLRSA